MKEYEWADPLNCDEVGGCPNEPIHAYGWSDGGWWHLCCGQHDVCQGDPQCMPIHEAPEKLQVERDIALMEVKK